MADHLDTTDDDSEPSERSARRRGPIIVPFVRPVERPAPRSLERAETRTPVAAASGASPLLPSPAAFRSERSSSVGEVDGGGPFAGVAAVVTAPEPPAPERPLPEPPARRRSDRSSTGEGVSDDVISDTIRRWARPTTLDELKSRGIRRVRSISMTRVGSLLEKAVNRALIERTLESDRGEALSLSSTAREQFVRLSQVEITGEAPTPEPEAELEAPLHERASSTLDRLKRELEDRRKVVADREKQLNEGDLDKAEEARLGNEMRELFATHAGVDDRLLEREVLDLVFGELRTSRRRARLARLEQHQREIGVLERRVSKLSVLLGETEDALRKVRAAKHTDDGVSSIYDEVQGLGVDDDQFEQKSDLMRSLFEANMALRQ